MFRPLLSGPTRISCKLWIQTLLDLLSAGIANLWIARETLFPGLCIAFSISWEVSESVIKVDTTTTK